MHINLEGKVAVVTGAGRGIGRDLVVRLAEEGVTTVALDVHEEQLAELGAELAEAGKPASQFRCDVRDSERIEDVIREIKSHYGRLDVLVNNAGVTGGGSVDTLSEETWRYCQDVNLTGTFLMCRAVVPVMKEQGSGRIINASSFAAVVPSFGGAAYAASKAAVTQFTRVLAGEVGPWSITANAYAPGMVPTDMNHFADRTPQEQEQLLDLLTLRRWGTKEDVGNLICYLASDQASYITGTMLDVSGGKLATQVPHIAHDRAVAGPM